MPMQLASPGRSAADLRAAVEYAGIMSHDGSDFAVTAAKVSRLLGSLVAEAPQFAASI